MYVGLWQFPRYLGYGQGVNFYGNSNQLIKAEMEGELNNPMVSRAFATINTVEGGPSAGPPETEELDATGRLQTKATCFSCAKIVDQPKNVAEHAKDQYMLNMAEIVAFVVFVPPIHSNSILATYRIRTFFGQSARNGFSHSAGVVSPGELERTEPSSLPHKKRLKVAIVGRPNAGKSTLINGILKLNVCDASPKTHTTRSPLRTAFTQGDTQIIFVDTPGLVTKKEFARFELSNAFLSWKENIFQEVDIVGIIHEVTSPKDIFKLHINLVQNINNVPETKSMFIILNKIDLVVDKAGLSEAIAAVTKSTEEDGASKLPNVWNRFSKVFLISALKNVGVQEVLNFLVEQAKPGYWLYRPSVVCNKPLHLLVTDLLRAQIMQILPNEVPYKCTYQVEYMEENDLGEIICVALIKCQKEKHLKILVSKRKYALRGISKKLESDLYKIIGKVFRLRIVASTPKK